MNQTLARRYWPDRDPVGEALLLFGEYEVRIAGVVVDVRYSAIVQAPRPAVYILPHFGGRRSMTLFVRTASDPLRAGNVLRLIIAQGIAPVLCGLAVGLIAARALARVLSSLLYGVEVTDPWTFASVALLLGAVALLAVYVPARRAARVDPIVALRAQ